MKSKIIFLFIFCSNVFVFGQEIYQFKNDEISVPNPKTIQNVMFNKYSNDAEKEIPQKINSKNYYKKIGEIDALVMLKNTTTADTIFVNKYELKEKANSVTSRWNFGMITLPMKIRFGGGSEGEKTKRYFDLEAGFNLGFALSYKLSSDFRSETQSHWVLSIGTSQIKLTPESTNGKIENDLSAVAFSPSTGLIFQFNNKLQFITIIGWDFVPGKIGTEWVYKDKPFFGLGLGFSVFEIGKKPE